MLSKVNLFIGISLSVVVWGSVLLLLTAAVISQFGMILGTVMSMLFIYFTVGNIKSDYKAGRSALKLAFKDERQQANEFTRAIVLLINDIKLQG